MKTFKINFVEGNEGLTKMLWSSRNELLSFMLSRRLDTKCVLFWGCPRERWTVCVCVRVCVCVSKLVSR